MKSSILVKSLEIRSEIDLKVGFRPKAIMESYNLEKILVVNVGFDLYYIVEYLEINVYNLEIKAYKKI